MLGVELEILVTVKCMPSLQGTLDVVHSSRTYQKRRDVSCVNVVMTKAYADHEGDPVGVQKSVNACWSSNDGVNTDYS